MPREHKAIKNKNKSVPKSTTLSKNRDEYGLTASEKKYVVDSVMTPKNVALFTVGGMFFIAIAIFQIIGYIYLWIVMFSSETRDASTDTVTITTTNTKYNVIRAYLIISAILIIISAIQGAMTARYIYTDEKEYNADLQKAVVALRNAPI